MTTPPPEARKRKGPKFKVGQVVASVGKFPEYMRITDISKHFAACMGYSGEFAMGLSKLRQLTAKERGK